MKETRYEECILYDLNAKLGPYEQSKTNVNGHISVDDMNKDVHNRLCSLSIRKSMRKGRGVDFSETLDVN